MFYLLILAGLAVACEDAPEYVAECDQGSLRCDCYDNGTCDEGLTCSSEVCVEEDGDTGGADGDGDGDGDTDGDTDGDADSDSDADSDADTDADADTDGDGDGDTDTGPLETCPLSLRGGNQCLLGYGWCEDNGGEAVEALDCDTLKGELCCLLPLCPIEKCNERCWESLGWVVPGQCERGDCCEFPD